jgi:hypothetical protein
VSPVSSATTSVVTTGFSPGVVGVYLLPLGKGRMTGRYYYPSTYRNYLSFHFAARKLMTRVSEMNGMVFELGLSYRFVTRTVASYKLKQGS